jgi:hypothetical protein
MYVLVDRSRKEIEMIDLSGFYLSPRFKIRLWDKPTSQMTNNVIVNPWLPLSITASFYDYTIVYSGGRLKDVVLMQNTGLFDKNHKPIYEEDIVKTLAGPILIKYCDTCKQFEPFILYDYAPFCLACAGDMQWNELVEDEQDLEVIGNFYENPELLRE